MMRRVLCTVLVFLLVLCLCTMLFSCKKKPAENPSDPENPNTPASPETPDQGTEENERQDGDTYRY